jgi:ABC-2 type transport system permease protein
MPIFDQGYQHWKGHLSGHGWRWLAITRLGVRIGMEGRIFRVVLLVSLLPAVVLATALCLWGLVERKSDLVGGVIQFLVSSPIFGPGIATDPKHYRIAVWTLAYNLFFQNQLFLSMILVVLVGPNLISQDLRFNALPLYLSRPLRRIDYLAGKLGVIAAFLGLAIIVPCVLAYVFGLLFSLDFTILKDTYRILLASIAYGLVMIVSSGMLILALSSLSRSSRWVAVFWLSLWIVGGIVSFFLGLIAENQRRQEFWQQQGQQVVVNSEAAPEAPRREKGRQKGRPPRERAQPRWEARREELQAKEAEAAKTDWRPLLSYTANLSRIGRQLLGTEAAWRTLAALQPPQIRGQLATRSNPEEYPWYWSAAVLAGLFGFSTCILSFSVRSLDRLR